MHFISFLFTVLAVGAVTTWGSCNADKDCPNPTSMGCLNKLCYVRDENCINFGNKCDFADQVCNICTGACYFPSLTNVEANCRVGGSGTPSNGSPAAQVSQPAPASNNNSNTTTTTNSGPVANPGGTAAPATTTTTSSASTDSSKSDGSKGIDWVVICSSLGALLSLLAGMFRFRKQIKNWWRKRQAKKNPPANLRPEGGYSYAGRENQNQVEAALPTYAPNVAPSAAEVKQYPMLSGSSA